MSDSDSSGLSSAPEEEVKKLAPIFQRAKKATKKAAPPPKASPPRPKRAPSPPHEETLADNPDIAFIVMFRSRFSDHFPPKLAHTGPQDLERGVQQDIPTKEVEGLLCALLGLVLNRKKPVEHGHYGRALEEAVSSHKSQWPLKWQGANPLHGGQDFNNMAPEKRLNLLRTLIMWSLSSSEEISTKIRDSYKQVRHAEDENQPLSVQPWGRDCDKRRYFLIEGQDDTYFRVYRENHRYTRNAQWYNMAGSIDEIKALAEKLEKEDGSQAARTLSSRMMQAIVRFEAGEEARSDHGHQSNVNETNLNPQKRRRRDYRQARRAAFTRPEPGFSMYEGRTRGKRMRYTYDDGEDEDGDDDNENFSDATSNRRSARQSGRNTPAEVGPQYTASGRQVKPRQGGEYGASLLSRQAASPDELGPEYTEEKEASDSEQPVRGGARKMRNGGSSLNKRKRIGNDEDDDGSLDDMSDDAPPSGEEWDSQANDDADDAMPDVDEDESDQLDEDNEDGEPRSLVVTLKTSGKAQTNGSSPLAERKSVDAAEEPTAAGALKAEPASSMITNGEQPSPTHLHLRETESKPTEYPTPTSTVTATIDKPIVATVVNPKHPTVAQATEEPETNGDSVTAT